MPGPADQRGLDHRQHLSCSQDQGSLLGKQKELKAKTPNKPLLRLPKNAISWSRRDLLGGNCSCGLHHVCPFCCGAQRTTCSVQSTVENTLTSPHRVCPALHVQRFKHPTDEPCTLLGPPGFNLGCCFPKFGKLKSEKRHLPPFSVEKSSPFCPHQDPASKKQIFPDG